jgi:hypothetical protein
MGGTAKPALEGILKALVSTAEPLSPIRWEDPVQFAHGQLAAAVFNGPLKDELNRWTPSCATGHPLGIHQSGWHGPRHAREFLPNQLSEEDVIALAPVILAAVENPSPADTMFNNVIRMAGLKALAKYHFKEGIAAAVGLAKTQGGHGSETRTGEIMKIITSYGSAAKPQIPALREVIAMFNRDTERGDFPPLAESSDRVGAVEDAIRSIETATTQPELRSLQAARPKGECGGADATIVNISLFAPQRRVASRQHDVQIGIVIGLHLHPVRLSRRAVVTQENHQRVVALPDAFHLGHHLADRLIQVRNRRPVELVGHVRRALLVDVHPALRVPAAAHAAR